MTKITILEDFWGRTIEYHGPLIFYAIDRLLQEKGFIKDRDMALDCDLKGRVLQVGDVLTVNTLFHEIKLTVTSVAYIP